MRAVQQRVRTAEEVAKEKASWRYHYTTNNALVGILSNREIWFSDPRFLNDAREWRHAGQIFSETIREVAKRHRSAWILAGCKEQHFAEMVENLCSQARNYEGRYFGENPVPMPFVFSLSMVDDALSQWRAYGNGEYCIGFNVHKLAEATKSKIVEVEYKKAEYDSSLDSMIDSFFSNHMQHIQKNGDIEDEVKYSGFQEFINFITESDYYIKFKDPGFGEEQEVRLVREVSCDDFGNIFFATNNRYPTPRLRVKLPGAPDLNKIIRRVICGPGADPQRSNDALAMMRVLWGTTLEPQYSKIPFRTS